MVTAVEKGDILHISHTENICQPKDILNILNSMDFPLMKDNFEIQIEEVIQKFDSPWLSLPGEFFFFFQDLFPIWLILLMEKI